MDPNELLQALQLSVGKTQQDIRLAERFLEQSLTAKGFMPNLLVIACNSELNLYVRQSAVVSLSLAVKTNWTHAKVEYDPLIEDKNTVKDNILEAVIKCADTKKVYKQLVEIIKYIVGFDFPTKWESFLPTIVNKIKTSNDFQEVYGCLLALYAIFRYYKDLLGHKPQLEALVDSTFEFLEIFAEKLLDDYGLQAAHAMHIILKIFASATYTWMPAYFLNDKNLEKWMTFFKLILDKDLSTDLTAPTNNERVIAEREKSIYWLNKKVCGRSVSSFLEKYRSVKNTLKESKTFSEMFLGKYAVPFLNSQMDLILKSREQYVHIKVLFYAFSYIDKALKSPDLRELLKDHLEILLFDILIPSMFLTPKDDEDWRDNPIEFIRAEEDVKERNNNLKTVNSRIFSKLCSPKFKISGENAGNIILIKFMKHAAEILSNGVDPRTNQPADVRLKEAILHIIGTIHSHIVDHDQILSQMEVLLDKYVIPEFQSQSGYLRYRACWLFGMYGAFEFKGNQIVRNATEGIYKCFLDKHLVVQIQAGIALERVLEQETAFELVQPELQKILEVYLTLLDAAENEHLVSAFENIIKKFGESVGPFAFALIQRLAKLFVKTIEDDGEEDDDDNFDLDDKQLAATGCLGAIENIMDCKLPKETLLQAQEILIPLLQFTLIDDKTDDVEQGLSLLNSILYYLDEINEKMWIFFLELNYSLAGKPQHIVAPDFDSLAEHQKLLIRHRIQGWATDYISLMVPCFQNYIKKGRNVIFSEKDPYFGLTYIELLFKSIDRVLKVAFSEQEDVDASNAAVIYITIIENYPKEIDNLIPYFLDKSIEILPRCKTNMTRKIFIQTIALCLWYNPTFTLQYLENKGATELVFKTWITLLPKFKLDFECERAMIGLASIFRVNVNDMPQLILTSLPDLIKQLISLSSKILVLRIEEEDENGGNDDDDEDGLDDFEDADEEMEKIFDKIHKAQLKEGGGIPTFVDKDSFDPNTLNGMGDDDLDKYDNAAKFQDFKSLEWLHTQAKYDSPFDGECEIMYLKQSLELMQQNQPEAFGELTGCLSAEEKTTLESNFVKAQEQVLEYQKLQAQGI